MIPSNYNIYLWPAVSLNFVFVVSTTSLQDWFVDTSTSSNKSDHGSVGRGDDFLGSRRELDPGPVGVGVVGDHGGVVAAGPRQLPAVPGLLLQVADDGSLGHVADGHHVADGDLGLLTTVHKLSGVHTWKDNTLILLFTSVLILIYPLQQQKVPS